MYSNVFGRYEELKMTIIVPICGTSTRFFLGLAFINWDIFVHY